jgi:hypothetical protein
MVEFLAHLRGLSPGVRSLLAEFSLQSDGFVVFRTIVRCEILQMNYGPSAFQKQRVQARRQKSATMAVWRGGQCPNL